MLPLFRAVVKFCRISVWYVLIALHSGHLDITHFMLVKCAGFDYLLTMTLIISMNNRIAMHEMHVLSVTYKEMSYAEFYYNFIIIQEAFCCIVIYLIVVYCWLQVYTYFAYSWS